MFCHLKHCLLIVMVVLLLILSIVYYFYWHWTPFTQNAFLFANTHPVSPLVEGYITEIHVKNNQFVKKGSPLFTTFRPPYELKAAQLRKAIESDLHQCHRTESLIKAEDAQIERFAAELANNRYLSDRAVLMYEGESVSQAYAEERFRAKQVSAAQIKTARNRKTALEHELNSIRSNIEKLRKELELAEIYFTQTVVYALNDGFVTNMSLVPGGYYKPGDVLFGFIDNSEWFVQANFKENELSEIRAGLPAEIWMWQYPGKTFHGVVESTGWSAERRRSENTGLPVIEKENEWFLLPQRFPVQIRITDFDPDFAFHHGASAYVKLNIPARPIRQFFWQLFLWW